MRTLSAQFHPLITILTFVSSAVCHGRLVRADIMEEEGGHKEEKGLGSW
jgi:hypothetical protein